MDSYVSIQFVKGGYIVHTVRAGVDADAAGGTTEVFTSPAKLVKSLRGLVDELSLVQAKAETAE
jgi:hypothetical protein